MILDEEKRESLKSDANRLLEQIEVLINSLQLEEALQKLQIVMNDFELLEDYSNYMKCHLMRAACHYNLGDLKMAFEITNEYEELCKKYKIPIDKAEYYLLLGLQYMYKEELHKAISYFDMSANHALKSEAYRRYISAKKHIAHVATKTKQYELGIDAINDAIHYLPHLSDHDVNQVELYLVEISLYIATKQFEKAEKLFDYLAVHPVLTIDDVTHSIYYEYYAKFLMKKNDLKRAYEYAEQGLLLLKDKNQFVSEQELFELLITICKKLGDTTKLVDVYERYVESLKQSKDQSYQEQLSKRDLEDMKKLTEIDSLTGVFNRKYLTEKATEWMNIAALNNEALVCCVFDVDHFKQINDTYGHLIGDEILKELASQCMDIIEECVGDIFLARYGGDEFVIVSRTRSIDQELQNMNWFHKNLNTSKFLTDASTFNLSVSMGISYTQYGEYKEFKQLFKEADEALYLSKQRGRKLISIYRESEKSFT